jgi:hypothetical protein
VRMPTAQIDYSMLRNGWNRQGTLRLAHTNAAQFIDDEFVESGTDVGVTFALSSDGSTTTTVLTYTSTNAGYDISFKYAIRQLR